MNTLQSAAAAMGKPAPADAPVHGLVRERWSPRAFSPVPVSSEAVSSLLEAARWAPSCMNEQPWAFVVADRDLNPESHARILSTLAPANQVWAGRAPILMISVARLTFSRNGSPNRWALYDTGQAVAQLVLQATSLGLVVHQMGGFDADQARALLAIPEGYEPMAAIAIGLPGDAASLSPELQARESAARQRRPAGDWVHFGSWSAK